MNHPSDEELVALVSAFIAPEDAVTKIKARYEAVNAPFTLTLPAAPLTEGTPPGV